MTRVERRLNDPRPPALPRQQRPLLPAAPRPLTTRILNLFFREGIVIHTSERRDQVVVVAELTDNAFAVSRVVREAAAFRPDHLVLVTGHVCDWGSRRCRVLAGVIADLKVGDFRRVTVQAAPQGDRLPLEGCPARQAAAKFTYVEDSYEPLPGWRVARVAEPDDAYAGATAIRLARRLDVSVVVSGMPDSVMIGETFGHEGRRRTLWGIEIGAGVTKARSAGARRGRAGFGVLMSGATRPRVVALGAATLSRRTQRSAA